MTPRIDDYASDDATCDVYESDIRYRRKAGKPARRANHERAERRREQREREKRRVAVSKPFKCRQCRSFIGAPVSGGRQRNHCPNCLHSLHVDLKTPGDRASECRSLMAPVASFFRPGGEQMVLHRCKGCGTERYNRIAADDNPLLLMRLELVQPRNAQPADDLDEQTASA